jgi:hypothetical protein
MDTNILSGSNNTYNISKLATSTRRKVQILRTDSPTFERLAYVRAKLDQYITSVSNTILTSQESIDGIHEIPCSSNHEKQPLTNARESSSQNKIKSKNNLATRPIDKITYEKTSTHNGSLKQKCSVEIWLPDICTDNGDGNTSRTVSPDSTTLEKISQSKSIKSRRSSISKISTTTINTKTKLFEEASSKTSDPIVIPHQIDPSEKRPRQIKSSSTIKSDTNKSNKNVKRPHTHRISASTNHTKKAVESATREISMPSKDIFPNIEQSHSTHKTKGSVGSGNSTMINIPMRKYSKRKTNKKLTQVKMQNTQGTYLYVCPFLRSLTSISDSTSHASSNQPTVAFKILLANTLPVRSTGNYHNVNKKILNRRLLNHKPSNSDNSLETNLISIIDHLQHRRNSTSKPMVLLPIVATKKTNDPFDSLESKIPFRLPIQTDTTKHISNSSNLLKRTTHGTESIPPCISKRSVPPPLPPPLLILDSAHTSTTGVSTNTVPVHLKYSKGANTDCNYLLST